MLKVQNSKPAIMDKLNNPGIFSKGEQMNLQKIYTALYTADLATAEAWYTKLIGRGPDNRPMKSLVQWELFEQSGIALSTDKEIAGKGVLFLYVDDVAAERRR